MQNNKLNKYLPELVYGGTDGAITTFSVMAGAAGAGLDSRIIIILGVASLFSDGLSMASSNYLSEDSKSVNLKIASIKKSLFTFASFVLIGLIPLTPFIFALAFSYDLNTFQYSVLFTLLSFILIGIIRAIVLKKSKLHLAIQTMIIGSICAAVAFYIGELISNII